MSYNFKPKKRPTFSLSGPPSAASSTTSLPLYYKDKLQSDSTFFQKHIKRRWNKLNRRSKMLASIFGVSIILYLSIWSYHFMYGDDTNGKQNDNKNASNPELWKQRKDKVREVFQESWSDYSRHGWGYDIYKPISQKGKNMGPKPLGWMIVDSLDTLVLMDLQDELHEARSWVKNELSYDFDYGVNVFETTIRMLGGLLSAHFLTEDDMYLEKATHLANTLLGSFESKSGIPYASVNLKTSEGIKFGPGSSSTAEVATLQLEFKYLANLTGEALYWEKVENIMKVLDDNHPEDGLVPIYINPETGKYQGKLIRLGSRGDSYYEYLLKQYLQTNEDIYLEMYSESVNGMRKRLLNKSYPSGLTFFGELEGGISGTLSNKMDHLVCFIGGLFALGATNGNDLSTAKNSPYWNLANEMDLDLGKELAKTCYHMYHDVPNSGLSPEIVVFNDKANSKEDFYIKQADKHNLQRPETIETLFYLYHITKDEIYREWGWEIFENFIKHTRVTDAGKDNHPRYTSLDDVTQSPSKKRDNMESFWLAETLKYFYLLFEDNLDPKWDFKNVVYNTEAHPLPKFEPRFKTGWRRSSNHELEDSVSQEKQRHEQEKIVNLEKEIVNEIKKEEIDAHKNDIAHDDKHNPIKVEEIVHAAAVADGLDSEQLDAEVNLEDQVLADRKRILKKANEKGEVQFE